MEPLEGVEFIQGDFTEDKVLDELLAALAEEEIPLFVDMGRNHWSETKLDWEEVFPQLFVIIIFFPKYVCILQVMQRTHVFVFLERTDTSTS